MATLMLLAFASCSSTDQSADDQSSEQQQEETFEDTNISSPDTLVIYFSATGNTKEIAEKIAEDTGADIYEIVPAVPYTDEDLSSEAGCR